MNGIRNIILWTAIGVLIVATSIFLYNYLAKSRESIFIEKYESFLKGFIVDFSKNWNALDVSDRLSVEFKNSLNRENAMKALEYYKELGRAKNIRGLELTTYRELGYAVLGIFKTNVIFENNEAEVVITLVERNGTGRVVAFHVNPKNRINSSIQISKAGDRITILSHLHSGHP